MLVPWAGAVAALAELAPFARDTTQRKGPGMIAGGRPVLRGMLYLASLQASRRRPLFLAVHARLQDRGKALEQAIIAIARKRLTILNAVIRDDVDVAEPPA